MKKRNIFEIKKKEKIILTYIGVLAKEWLNHNKNKNILFITLFTR